MDPPLVNLDTRKCTKIITAENMIAGFMLARMMRYHTNTFISSVIGGDSGSGGKQRKKQENDEEPTL